MTTIFVSYSHLDRKWCDPKAAYPLIPWLENALRRDGVTLWYDRSDDTGILPGAEFQAAILNAIDASQVALLLVSEAFFASDFIRDIELPRILQRAEADGLAVIPILLEPCDWQSFEYVASRQMLPGEPTPLINYTGSDREWVYARDQVLSGIRRRLRERAPVKPAPLIPTPVPPPRRRWVPIAIIALVALAIAVGAGWGLSRGRGGKPPEPSAPAALATAAQATATAVRSQAAVGASPRAPSPEAAQPTQPPAAPKASPTPAQPARAPTAPEASAPTAPPPLSSPTSPPAIPLAPANAASIAPLVHRSEEEVRQLAWLPDGQLLLSLMSNIVVQDPATGLERTINDRGAEVLTVGQNAEGQTLLAIADRETLQIRDAESGGEVATIPALKDARALAFSPDGTLLAAGLNEAVKLVEVPSGREVDTLLGVISSVQRVAFSPDGKTLAAGGQNVMLWNVADRAELANFKVQPWVKGLAFSPDNKLLAVGSFGGLELYDVTTITDSRPRMARKISEDQQPDLAWSPDGALLAWTSAPALVRLWDVAEGREAATLKGHTAGIVGLGFSPDGKWLATGTRDGLRLWGAGGEGPAPSPAPPAAGPVPTPVPLSPAAITAANAAQVTQLDQWDPGSYNAGGLAWSPDGAWLVCWPSTMRIYDVTTKQMRYLESELPAQVAAIAPALQGVAGNGSVLAAGGYEGIQLLDPVSGGELASYPQVKNVRALAFSPDGSLLAAGANLAVKVLSAADGREIDTLLGAAVDVFSVAFSPDGKTLAAGGQNIITWEWPGGREIANVKIDPWATHLIFTPDGKTLVAATHTGVKIYEAATLRLLRSIGEEEPSALALSPDGKLLAWASRRSPIRLVDLSNGKEVATLTGHTDEVRALAFSPEGARLASAANDSTIRFWGVGQ